MDNNCKAYKYLISFHENEIKSFSIENILHFFKLLGKQDIPNREGELFTTIKRLTSVYCTILEDDINITAERGDGNIVTVKREQFLICIQTLIQLAIRDLKNIIKDRTVN